MIRTILHAIEAAQEKQMYVDCQEGALALCDFIENTYGEGTRTVDLLEQYCVLIFKVNNNELDYSCLHETMAEIKSSAYELEPAIDIVFFPYKVGS